MSTITAPTRKKLAAALALVVSIGVMGNTPVEATYRTASADDTYYSVTRRKYYEADQTSGGVIQLNYKFYSGWGRVYTKSGTPSYSITKSVINPQAKASGLSLSASFSSSGAVGIGASAGGGTCNFGDFSANSTSVSVSQGGEICKVTSYAALWSPRVEVVGKTLFGTNKWRTF